MINSAILTNLLTSLPMVIVALGSMVAALVLWRRAPLSSLLVVLACISSLALIIAYPFAYKAVVHLQAGDTQSLARIDNAFGLGWSIARAIYLILLVVAVYVGRKNSYENIRTAFPPQAADSASPLSSHARRRRRGTGEIYRSG